MGPRKLNQFFRLKQPDGIKEIALSEFSGKTIVVDASIYLYRFNTNNELIENLYIMICILRVNNITPLFIFDGKPPPEKYESLNIRRKQRDDAEKMYEMLVQNNNVVNVNKNLLEKIKRKKTKINLQNIQEVKSLLEVCGVSYVDAVGEADELCAYCVIKNIAYACLSDDMDLFIYGCPRIMRYFSMMNQNVVYYELEKILSSLKITQDIFINMSILSGTDYNEEFMSFDKLYYDFINNNEEFNKNILDKFHKDVGINNIKKYYSVKGKNYDNIISMRKKYFNYSESNEKKFLLNYHFVFIE